MNKVFLFFINSKLPAVNLNFLTGLIISTLFFSACSQKQETLPAGIISKEKMIAILIDVQQAEAKIQANNLGLNDSTKNIAYGYYEFIFNKHQIKSTDFKESFSYYASNMELLDAMYAEVIIGLSKKQAEETGKNK